ncbi:Domain of Uncharacterised Function with PDB structure [Serratia entomophila]|uniref:DUF3850 domain-containing protein n=1 Tax=Serratia entomophila TaxID=42906 RepID=UPI0021796289|nr:DUF3850 domain-containing protein [Serratia entomophila]CAI1155480.1 Domain of Uncharacterised Function with PDB structure [Serratia entomophila]CAI1177160.1 Domain of Uncharacterised Function with PDB structure [Serratia entomophila]
MKTHELKIKPEFLTAVINGEKKAEFRLNDRCFAVGDLLRLSEIDYLPEGGYCGRTGNHTYVQVTHIADLSEWVPGYVLLSIKRGPFKV